MVFKVCFWHTFRKSMYAFFVTQCNRRFVGQILPGRSVFGLINERIDLLEKWGLFFVVTNAREFSKVSYLSYLGSESLELVSSCCLRAEIELVLIGKSKERYLQVDFQSVNWASEHN